jgi:hypothetical protein
LHSIRTRAIIAEPITTLFRAKLLPSENHSDKGLAPGDHIQRDLGTGTKTLKSVARISKASPHQFDYAWEYGRVKS